MIYDYEKWSVLEPSVVQNKLNTWPKDYTSIVVTKMILKRDYLRIFLRLWPFSIHRQRTFRRL